MPHRPTKPVDSLERAEISDSSVTRPLIGFAYSAPFEKAISDASGR